MNSKDERDNELRGYPGVRHCEGCDHRAVVLDGCSRRRSHLFAAGGIGRRVRPNFGTALAANRADE